MGEIDAVYFSCGRDRELVHMSLVFLLSFCVCRSVYVIGDPKDAFAEEDILKLTRLSPRISVINSSTPVENHGSNGVRAIASEVSWYKQVLSNRSDNDFIVKLDSDTLIVGRRIFDFTSRGNSSVVGSGIHLDGVTFFRGACYFLRKEVVDSLFEITSARDFEARINRYLEGDRRVISPESYCYEYPEDRVIDALVRRLAYSPTLVDYILDLEGPVEDWNFSSFDVLHFPGEVKRTMASVFKRLIGEREIVSPQCI